METYLWTLLLVAGLPLALGHGRMMSPPSRTSMWRSGFNNPQNYNDNGMDCGGISKLAINGQCGVCGDDYRGMRTAEPGPDNEYANGIIVGAYEEGSVMAITIEVTFNNKGFYEFRLCDNNVPQVGKDSSVRVDQSCFDQHLLLGVNGSSRFPAGPVGNNVYNVRLPAGVTCQNCILQWRWKTASNWACDTDGCGLGYGLQTEFWNCADITIVNIVARPTIAGLPVDPTQPPRPGVTGCTGKNSGSSNYDRYCSDTCSRDYSVACQYLCNCPNKVWTCTSRSPLYTGRQCYDKCTAVGSLNQCPNDCSCRLG